MLSNGSGRVKLTRLTRSSAARAVAGTGAVNMLSMLLGIVSGVITARGLGPEDRGVLISLLVWSATVGSLSLTGIDEAVIFHAGGSSSRAWALRSAVARDAAVQSALGCLVLLGSACYIVRPHGVATWLSVVATTAVVPLNTFTLLSIVPLRAGQRMKAWNSVRLTQPVVYAFGAAVLWAAGQLTILSALAANLIGGLLLSVFLVALARRGGRARLAPGERRATTSYGRRLVLATLPQRIGPRLDQLLLGLLFAPAVLGVYSVATSIAAVVLMIGTSLDQVLFPRFSAGHFSRPDLANAVVAGMGAGLAVSLAMAAMARPMIELLYGRDFLGAAEPLTILLLAAVVRVGANCLGAALKASGTLRAYAWAQIAGVLTLAGVFPLAVGLGGVGAAIASLAGALVTFLVSWGAVATIQSTGPALRAPVETDYV
ncbi:Membrane protein involved in the export of O-antigen and teichoic acid [Actinopolymorpha singaporensis]|uniref:Membrane protein involved in the export of O-antigen and teichoic acid n=1 Tax=Actinopolymorpha singaporensis TaxID=117157 RepID=A0A1H1MNX6_9ACTN|nr:Membrane protein involved in the export of O-antigen and teichoic acid [Actinopolymorpha singaporensis]